MTGHSGNTLMVNDPGFTKTSYQVSEVTRFAIYTKSGKLHETADEEMMDIIPDVQEEATDLFMEEVEVVEPVEEDFLLQGSCSCDSIQNMVAQAEGNKPCMYVDTAGHPTIGIGFNLDRGDARSIITSLGLNYDNVRAGKTCLSAG